MILLLLPRDKSLVFFEFRGYNFFSVTSPLGPSSSIIRHSFSGAGVEFEFFPLFFFGVVPLIHILHRYTQFQCFLPLGDQKVLLRGVYPILRGVFPVARRSLKFGEDSRGCYSEAFFLEACGTAPGDFDRNFLEERFEERLEEGPASVDLEVGLEIDPVIGPAGLHRKLGEESSRDEKEVDLVFE